MKKLYALLLGIIYSTCLYPSDPITLLKERYPWPISQPQVAPDPESLFCNAAQMATLLKSHGSSINIIVELGSWLGASTRFMLDTAPHALVLAIDHWKGSIEHTQYEKWSIKLATLYDTFLVNCWNYQERLIPMRTTTLQGLQEIYELSITPDLIYIDASHDYESVTKELELIHLLFPTTIIIGDDWGYPGIHNAVHDFCQRHNFTVESNISFWRLIKP